MVGNRSFLVWVRELEWHSPRHLFVCLVTLGTALELLRVVWWGSWFRGKLEGGGDDVIVDDQGVVVGSWAVCGGIPGFVGLGGIGGLSCLGTWKYLGMRGCRLALLV